MKEKILSRNFLVIMICGLATLLVVMDVIRGPWNHDSGFYLEVSSWLSSGFRPYLDFQLYYTPLMMFLNSLLISALPDRSFLALFIPLVWIWGAALATFWAGRKLFSEKRALALIACFYFVFSFEHRSDHVSLEHATVLFTIVSFGFFWNRNSGPGSWILSGVFIAAAILSKQIAVVNLLIFPFLIPDPLASNNFKRWSCFILGGLLTLPPLGLLVRFRWLSLYTEFLRPFLAYISRSPGKNFGFLKTVALELPLTFGMVIFCIFALVYAWKSLANEKKKGLIIVSLLLAFYHFSTRFVRNYPHYSLNAWPFVALVLILTWMHMNPIQRHGALRAGIIASLACLALGSPQWKWYRWQRPNIVYNFFAPIAAAVNKKVPPNEKILVLGDQEILYFLSERLPQAFYTDANPDVPIQSRVVLMYDEGQSSIATYKKSLAARGYSLVQSFHWDAGQGHGCDVAWYEDSRKTSAFR